MLKNYLKIALKGLTRHKYYTFVSLFGIIITLIILTVSVALINHMSTMGKSGSKLNRSLLANRIEAKFKEGHIISFPSYWMLNRYIRDLKGAEAISIFSGANETVIYADNKRIPLTIKYTDEVFWDIVEFPFLEGMPYKKDAIDKASMVAIITDQAKQKIFGGKPALGKYIETSEGTFQIIGIIPYREINAMALNAEIYAPISTSLGTMNNKQLWGDGNALIQVIDKSQFASVKNEFQKRIDEVRKDYQAELEIQTLDCFIGTPGESIAKEVQQSELVYYTGIIGIMILFMLLPAVNLTTINISRIMERYPEIGIRKALGASSSTLMGQFIIENIILTIIGGIIAYFLSKLIFIFINDSGVIPWGYIKLDAMVFFYSMVVTIFFGIFSGILPSFKMSRLHPAEALKGIKQ